MDRSDLVAVRALLLRMISEGQGDDAVALVIHLLSGLRDENVDLQQRLRNALRQLYGRRSEKLDAKDRALLERLAGVSNAQGDSAPPTSTGDATPKEGASPAPGAQDVAPKKTLPEGAAHGRGGKPTGLPEKRTPKPVPGSERWCPKCGCALHALAPVDTWQIE